MREKVGACEWGGGMAMIKPTNLTLVAVQLAPTRHIFFFLSFSNVWDIVSAAWYQWN